MSEVDADLVRRTLAGDRSAFEALVTAHLPRAQALARALVGEHQAVDDIVQEAFLRAYDRLGQLADPSGFAAWVAAIVRNEGYGWLRKQARRRNVGLDAAPPTRPAESEDPALDRLRAALVRLPADYREILALKYEAGCDYETIADTLGTSVANVEKRLYRARQALIRLLPDLGR